MRFCYVLTQKSLRLWKYQAQQIFVTNSLRYLAKKLFHVWKGPDDALGGAKLSCISVSLINQNVKPDRIFKFQNQNLKSCKKLSPCRLAHLTLCFGSSAVEIT